MGVLRGKWASEDGDEESGCETVGRGCAEGGKASGKRDTEGCIAGGYLGSNSGVGGRIGTGPRALGRGAIGLGVDICMGDILAAGEGGRGRWRGEAAG